MDIKEIVLKLQATDRFRLNVSELSAIEFAEALVAELAEQNEPIAWLYPNETALSEHETDGPVVKERIPLYTIPPTAEQIANETAEAIARMLENGSFLTPESRVALAANGAAKAIRSGAWKEFK